MKKKIDTAIGGRMKFVLAFFFVALALLLGRFFVLQIVDHRKYLKLAAQQHRLVQEVFSERGFLFMQDKNGQTIPVAMNRTYSTLIASPKQIKQPSEAAAWLASQLHIAQETLVAQFTKKNDQYEVVARKISPEEREKIEQRRIEGITFEEEKRRVYPHGATGANIIGFVSKQEDKEVGKYGLERFYERDLAGEKGILEGAKDASGFWVGLGKRIVNPPKNGSSLLLTVDYNIQHKAEEMLKKVREKWHASSGTIVVTDPLTGKILALAVNPDFDPNLFAKERDFSVFLNPVVESTFELGSVMKPVIMAAGIEEGLVRPDTTYTDPGQIKIAGFTIKNFDEKSYGLQTMTQVIEKSLNTGVVYVARLLGQGRHSEYLRRFGFGAKTGIDLPGEVTGNLSNLLAGREVDYLTASFGQGIAITPLQLAGAIGAIANQGKLMQPFVVEKIIDDSGAERIISPQVKRQVVSSQTAEAITKMLVSAVRSGFENKAGVKGYFVAGKTGTAQIPRRDGRGYSDKVIHTFVGYAPAFKPRFLVVLQINEPQGNRFAANTLTPAFHELAEYIFNYYQVPPDEQ
ncbi:MAG: penicillin-binding protein 2 [Candidatus Sungbacteria bacterium]|nr:penicillin-binding protein 2 [Candidatus Sungbacteria bacterium]